MTDSKDNTGHLIVSDIAYQTKNDSWADEFQAWYKREKWFSSRRAASTFIALKIYDLQEQIKKNEKGEAMTEKQEALKAIALKNSMKSAIDLAPMDEMVIAALTEIEMQYQTVRAALTETPKADVVGLVGRQANDDGLWFMAKTAAEAYLQQELRKLHAAIEGQAFTEAPKVDVEELYKGSRRLSSLHTGRVALVESQHDEGWNDCLDHITTHYHLVKKEKKHD